MHMEMLSFTPAQASALTGLSVKTVNKAIENRAVPARTVREGHTRKRYIPYRGLICLELEAQGLRKLPLHMRRDVFRRVVRCHRQQELRYTQALVIDVQGARTKMLQSLLEYRKAKRMIVSDPEIMGGTPVFKGTRIPVYTIAEIMSNGTPSREILDSYPSLSEEMLSIAVLYADANPRRGRPVTPPWRRTAPTRNVVRPLVRRAANAIPH